MGYTFNVANPYVSHFGKRFHRRRQERIKNQEQNQFDINKSRTEQQYQEGKEKTTKAREEGKARAEEILSRNYPGLTQAQQEAYRGSANRSINNQLQRLNQQLKATQGSRGIRGSSGMAYSQQKDLGRLGLEAQGEFERDLTKMDADLALKKMAAAVALEEGSAAEDILSQQAAADIIKNYNEDKYQKYLAEKANRFFKGI